MKRCLCCHERFLEKVSWRQLFLFEGDSLLCPMCISELNPLADTGCPHCSRLGSQPNEVCQDCFRWESNKQTAGMLERNVSLYEYNDFLKNWLTSYKFHGDTAIAQFFSEELRLRCQKEFAGYQAVPVPLSEERLAERRFNQAELLIADWTDVPSWLKRINSEKQSKKSRSKRIASFTNNPFFIEPDRNLEKTLNKIVIIDDIYTTGTTVRQVAAVLKAAGINKIASMTIAR